MPGPRVLLAAEFPRGGATLARLLPLGRALAERGFIVEHAVPDGARPASGAFPARASSWEAAPERSVPQWSAPQWPAPRWPVAPPAGFAAVSYADILLQGGYGSADVLRSLLDRWRTVLAAGRPDLVVVDFAPTALLAARMLGVKVAAVGDGFSLPPAVAPLPLLRPWLAQPAEAASGAEARVLAVVNDCLGGGWPALRTLFQDVPRFLCAVPELDHYPDRVGDAYFGGVFAELAGPAPPWPPGERRVYVELDARHPVLTVVASVLERMGWGTLIQENGMGARQAEALEEASVQVTSSGLERQ